MKPWILKHIPRGSEDIIGQEKALKQLNDFLDQKKKKAALLYGPPGCGKTSSVYALARERNLEVVEVNASDVRNQATIQSLLGAATQQMSLLAEGKIILVDEIDGVSGTKDRGGLNALAKIIESTSFHVVMTSNDIADKKFKALRKSSVLIPFDLLDHTVSYEVLNRIVEREKLHADDDALKSLARRSAGDMRGLITDAQLLFSGRQILKKEDVEELSERNRTASMEQALLLVFKSTDLPMVIHAFDDVEEDLQKAMLWLEENIPSEYPDIVSRASSFDALSKADVFQGRIRRWQHWRFLVYVNTLITGGVALAKKERSKKTSRFRQPSRLLKMYIAKMRFQKQRAIAEHLAAASHSTARDVLSTTLPYLKRGAEKNPEFARELAEEYDLDEQQEIWLSERNL